MNEEQETKKEWVTPEIADLDMDKTSKSFVSLETLVPGTSFGPS